MIIFFYIKGEIWLCFYVNIWINWAEQTGQRVYFCIGRKKKREKKIAILLDFALANNFSKATFLVESDTGDNYEIPFITI